MPELPEVETIVAGLRPGVVGRTVMHVKILGPLVVKSPAAAFGAAWAGSRIDGVSRHGKAIFFSLSRGGHAFVVRAHLGMTGQLLFCPSAATPDRYTRVVLHFGDGRDDVHYRDIRQFGKWNVVEEAREPGWGPDAWEESEQTLFEALRRKSGMIKHALLNQHVLAGLGNIYVDESLHATGVHPRQTLERLSREQLRSLCSSIKAVLKRSLGLGGTSFRNYVDTRGETGGFKGRLRVYGKQGKPCPVCSTPVRRIVVASRGTHFCPRCQPAPRPRRAVVR